MFNGIKMNTKLSDGFSLNLVASDSVTQANSNLAVIDAGAMIDIGINLSTYAGNDTGLTKYKLIYYDSANKKVQGFIGASGGGEALGIELATAWANSTGNPFETFDGAAPPDITSAINTVGTARCDCGDVGNAGALFKASINATINGGGGINWAVGRIPGNFSPSDMIEVSVGAQNIYLCTTLDPLRTVFGFYVSLNANFSTVMSLKRVTDVSTNGVHLHSTKNGVDRNVVVDTDFNLNDASGYTYELYKILY